MSKMFSNNNSIYYDKQHQQLAHSVPGFHWGKLRPCRGRHHTAQAWGCTTSSKKTSKHVITAIIQIANMIGSDVSHKLWEASEKSDLIVFSAVDDLKQLNAFQECLINLSTFLKTPPPQLLEYYLWLQEAFFTSVEIFITTTHSKRTLTNETFYFSTVFWCGEK